ncbi:endonuclease/exonuclease/phosphatase family protein [Schumannella sp. 10F1B-5-1]|uniref:endonuclease/exonuclease/phosphatase family protein n=1 Tax=Schumannella sp. 10F1B-5-1 TaxID=2590780 RepID=UPI001130307B|nr:endonuclease/exonuclease/phosphatase family protein [Schumannella sp. 10F1B-5-1]TPW71545.1 endonuclease/exonuclease/phosphatase family protein [Schumannella sp. 10F1B-5-1]
MTAPRMTVEPLESEIPASTARPAPALRVATANVRIPVDAGTASWSARGRLLARTLHDSGTHVIGVQELRSGPAVDLLSWMPGTAWFGRDRRGGHDDEHVGLLYRPDRLELLDGGDFWLSDTLHEPGSITWGNLFPRMVTWARFRDREIPTHESTDAAADLLVAVTHLPYRPADERARIRSAELIAAELDALAAEAPIVLLGDMNTGPQSATHETLIRAGFVDARESPAAHHTGPDATFHAFTGDPAAATDAGEPGERIDWILQRGFEVTATATLDAHGASPEHDGAVWPSDHFPVTADLVRR